MHTNCSIKFPNEKLMEGGEVELSSSNSNTRGSLSIDPIDQFLKHTRTCTHTHTCNPPGPETAHTHTCYHTHTQVISSGGDPKTLSGASSLKPRRGSGNREAVRKYREKKKAYTAYLEEEVEKLRVLNQQLVRKVQGQAVLRAEILRLRALLFDLKGKIEIELGSFPFEKMQVHGSVDGVGLQCQTVLPCLKARENGDVCVDNGGSGRSKDVISWEGGCNLPGVGGCVVGNGENGFDNPVDGAEIEHQSQ